MKKMKKMKKIMVLIVFCFSQLFIQCSNDDNKEIEVKTAMEQYTGEVNLLRNFLSTSIPMEIKKIIYNSDRKDFIIDGDILMSLEDARDHFNHSNSKITNKTNQRGNGYRMTFKNSTSIKVYVSPEVSSEWRVALNQAIDSWNAINSSIAITIVNTSTNETINVTTYNEGISGGIARASLPSHIGQPGRFLGINTYYNNLDASKKITTMTHELGHNFGFNHTNELNAPLIPCTPLSDMYSVMFPIVDSWTGFSDYDIIAISTLYPVVVGTKKLYRYKKNQYYFYATDACEITPGKDGYVLDGDAGYLYSTQIAGTVPLYRILNGATVKDHRLNKVQASSSDVILGYLFTTQQPGTTALYSYGIYELRWNETPSYMYHYMCTVANSDGILKTKIGYVPNKIIIEETPRSPILF
jgi:hypothetical protein